MKVCARGHLHGAVAELSITMRWIPLDLEAFTAISQEVDDVVGKHRVSMISQLRLPAPGFYAMQSYHPRGHNIEL